MPRKTAVQDPPVSKDRCPIVILGESRDSGHDSGLGGMAKIPFSSIIHEGFLGGAKTSP